MLVIIGCAKSSVKYSMYIQDDTKFNLQFLHVNRVIIIKVKVLFPHTVPELPLCLGVLKHRAPLARGVIFLPKYVFTMDFCLYWAILNLKALCFGAITDIMMELIVYWGVPQSRQS
jgi:hypothetical protein